MPAISRVRRKWSIDIGISRLISVGMRAITFVLHQQVVCAALKSYNSHVRSNASDSSIAILSPFNAYMRYTHRSHSAAPGVSSPSAWTNHHWLVQVLEWRAVRAVEAYASLNTKGEIDASADKRVCRPVTEAFVAGQASEMIDGLPFADPTITIVSSLLRLVRLLLTYYHTYPLT